MMFLEWDAFKKRDKLKNLINQYKDENKKSVAFPLLLREIQS